MNWRINIPDKRVTTVRRILKVYKLEVEKPSWEVVRF